MQCSKNRKHETAIAVAIYRCERQQNECTKASSMVDDGWRKANLAIWVSDNMQSVDGENIAANVYGVETHWEHRTGMWCMWTQGPLWPRRRYLHCVSVRWSAYRARARMPVVDVCRDFLQKDTEYQHFGLWIECHHLTFDFLIVACFTNHSATDAKPVAGTSHFWLPTESQSLRTSSRGRAVRHPAIAPSHSAIHNLVFNIESSRQERQTVH